MRLGFATGVYGARNMPAHDARPLAEGASLSVSLAYLRDILQHMRANAISMYRLHGQLLPGLAGRTWGNVQREIDECLLDLQFVGEMVAQENVRLSFHPQTAVVLNTPDEDLLARGVIVLRGMALLLDRLGCGPEGVIVLHVGGVYGDEVRAKQTFMDRYLRLPDEARRRVVLEHDDRRFGLADVLSIHEACGVPIVLDPLHHQVLNPERIPMEQALAAALTTWPSDVRPKIHYATARSDMRTWGSSGRIKPPSWTEHADFVNPFEFAAFLGHGAGLRDFDVMLEAKARDLALIKLRQDLARFEPAMAERLS